MIQRERAASGAAETVSGPASGRATPAPAGGVSPATHRPAAWEDLYRALSADQQRELLSLAERQGIVYAHQLPGAANGTAVDRDRQLFARILSGAVAELQLLYAEPVP